MPDNNFTTFPILNTERLLLRQLRISDDHEIFALRSNEIVNKYLNRKPSTSIDDAKDFINSIIDNDHKNHSLYWAITLNGSEKLIGTICLFNLSDDHSKLEIGFELLPGFQGKGVMNEAALAVLRFAFEKLRVNIIEACTHSENERSIILLEKLGFERRSDDGKCAIFNLRLTI